MMKLFDGVAVGLALVFSGCQTDQSAGNGPEENPGRDLVMESIEAHGGKEAWYGSGLLQFRWTYHMTDRGADTVVDTVQTFDPVTMAVRHEVVGTDIEFGMKEGELWIRPEGAEFSPPPRFWALTPIYFLGIPFVFNDPGANFELLDETIGFEGEEYTQVKVTYEPSAGDSPDDYYVLLIDPETKLVRGTYYIVTSELVAKDGPGPRKLITLDDLQDVGGVKLASGHRTFAMDDGKIGEQMRFTEVSEVKWVPKDAVDFDAPE